jgi:hypothetical protein
MIGTLECSSVFSYDWVIESDWAKIEQTQTRVFNQSPKFVIKNISFGLAFFSQTKVIDVWLEKYSKEPVTIDSLTIYLVSETTQQICSRKGLSFAANDRFLNHKVPNARFAKPTIFLDGELRIRCHLSIKSDEKAKENVVDLKGPSLIEDLRREISNQFSDFTLVISKKSYPVILWSS